MIHNFMLYKYIILNKNKIIYIYANFIILFIFSIIYWIYGTSENFTFQPQFGANDQISYISALFYSFTTHSTVGYGDITPKSKLMQIITMFHLTILIANLSLLLI